MEEYFTEEHADTCKKKKRKPQKTQPNPFARLIQANTFLHACLLCPPTPPCRLRVSRGVLLLLHLSRASSQHEPLVTCCNLAYFESSSPALLRRHQQSQTERDGGQVRWSREKEGRSAAEVFYLLSWEAEPPSGSPETDQVGVCWYHLSNQSPLGTAAGTSAVPEPADPVQPLPIFLFGIPAPDRKFYVNMRSGNVQIHRVQIHTQAVILLFQANLSWNNRRPVSSIQLWLFCILFWVSLLYSRLVIAIFLVRIILH